MSSHQSPYPSYNSCKNSCEILCVGPVSQSPKFRSKASRRWTLFFCRCHGDSRSAGAASRVDSNGPRMNEGTDRGWQGSGDYNSRAFHGVQGLGDDVVMHVRGAGLRFCQWEWCYDDLRWCDVRVLQLLKIADESCCFMKQQWDIQV